MIDHNNRSPREEFPDPNKQLDRLLEIANIFRRNLANYYLDGEHAPSQLASKLALDLTKTQAAELDDEITVLLSYMSSNVPPIDDPAVATTHLKLNLVIAIQELQSARRQPHNQQLGLANPATFYVKLLAAQKALSNTINRFNATNWQLVHNKPTR